MLVDSKLVSGSNYNLEIPIKMKYSFGNLYLAVVYQKLGGLIKLLKKFFFLNKFLLRIDDKLGSTDKINLDL